MSKLEDIEKRRAERKAASAKDRAEQEERDLEAIDALEAANGEDLTTMTVAGFAKGLPVRVALRPPSAAYYKRFSDLVRRAGNDQTKRGQAQEQLGECCWAYPTPENKDTRDAMKDAFPGTLISLAIEAAKLAELRSEEEGKG